MAVRCCRLSRRSLRAGNLGASVKFLTAAGTYLGMAYASRHYFALSNIVATVTEEVAGVADGRVAVMLTKAPVGAVAS
jgi:hypothetical protein